MGLTRISVEEIMDYANCPMLYKLKHVDKASTMYLDLLEKYDSDIHKFMYAYHSSIQNGGAVDASAVKRIWGSLWIGEKNRQDLIFTETNSPKDTWNDKRKKGLNDLIAYHSGGAKNIGTPVLINHGFEVKIDDGLYMTGKFELIQQLNNSVQLVNFKAETRSVTKRIIDKELETTAMSYAFRETFSQPEDGLLVYFVDRHKHIATSRDKRHFDMLKYSARNIANAIENEIFYVSPDSKCVSCVYRQNCDNFLITENML